MAFCGIFEWGKKAAARRDNRRIESIALEMYYVCTSCRARKGAREIGYLLAGSLISISEHLRRTARRYAKIRQRTRILEAIEIGVIA